ncbi:hypothetical protein LTR85_004341 [Meristemomyces frigidus]|nr:hypothetical protein LTR85_004341 [Meristemomyces frigidus]
MYETALKQAAAQTQCAPNETLPDVEQTTRPSRVQFDIDEGDDRGTDAVGDDTQYPKGATLYAISGALAIVLVSIGLDGGIMAVTLPALSDHFHTIRDIGWYSTTLNLVMCSFVFLFGKAYTLFSVKHLFLLSLVIFEVGNVLCTFAQSSPMFIFGRAIAGLGCAGLLSGVFTIFTHTFPLGQRAMVGGIGGGIEMLSNVSAAPVGGALISGWTWRACFGINIPLGIFGCVLISYLLQLPPNPDETLPLKEKLKGLDLAGTAVFAPAVVCLLLPLQWGGSVYRWDSAQIIALFILSGFLLSAFIVIEWKSGERASLPLRIFKKRSLLAGSFFGFCCNSAAFVTEYYMSIYFQGVRGYSAAKTGALALPLVAGMSIAAPLAGAFTTWAGYYFPTMYTATVFASVAVGVLTTIHADTSLSLLMCMLALLGFAVGLGIQAPQVAAQTVLEAKEVSIGLAVVQFGSWMGPVLFLSAGATLFANRLNAEIHAYSPSTNITSIDNMGLTELRNTLGNDVLNDVLAGYSEALVQTLYLPLTLCCASIIGCIAMERKSVKKTE